MLMLKRLPEKQAIRLLNYPLNQTNNRHEYK